MYAIVFQTVYAVVNENVGLRAGIYHKLKRVHGFQSEQKHL